MYRARTCEIMRLTTLLGNRRFRFLHGGSYTVRPGSSDRCTFALSIHGAIKTPTGALQCSPCDSQLFCEHTGHDFNFVIRPVEAFRAIRPPDRRSKVRLSITARAWEALNQFKNVQGGTQQILGSCSPDNRSRIRWVPSTVRRTTGGERRSATTPIRAA